jgi:ATP-dependent Lon protease
LGGVRDEAEIRGHRRTYIGALPGRILQTMRRAGTANPIFMLDEIDKLGNDFRGDPSSALLEVLDPEQNHAFSDHYLELPYDLSKVMFITTANSLHPLPEALLDRLEVIEFSGYTDLEKVEIAKQFIVPRQIEQHGLAKRKISIDDSTLSAIIRQYTYEAGVRNLEREIANVCRKIARQVATGNRKYPRAVNPEHLLPFLGPPQFLETKIEGGDQVGRVVGMAWTEGGGDVMEVEVSLMAGKGMLTLTGRMGDVMEESAQTAMSYIRSQAKQLGIKADTFDKTDIHVHMPEAAIPKDGPSAGVTIATAIISALTGRRALSTLAMTGEITLRGRVLPVGGVKEKVLAAHRSGLKKVLLPARNEKDLVDVPAKVLEAIAVVYVTSLEEVLAQALGKAEPSKPAAKKPAAKPRPKPVKKTSKVAKPKIKVTS